LTGYWPNQKGYSEALNEIRKQLGLKPIKIKKPTKKRKASIIEAGMFKTPVKLINKIYEGTSRMFFCNLRSYIANDLNESGDYVDKLFDQLKNYNDRYSKNKTEINTLPYLENDWSYWNTIKHFPYINQTKNTLGDLKIIIDKSDADHLGRYDEGLNTLFIHVKNTYKDFSSNYILKEKLIRFKIQNLKNKLKSYQESGKEIKYERQLFDLNKQLKNPIIGDCLKELKLNLLKVISHEIIHYLQAFCSNALGNKDEEWSFGIKGDEDNFFNTPHGIKTIEFYSNLVSEYLNFILLIKRYPGADKKELFLDFVGRDDFKDNIIISNETYENGLPIFDERSDKFMTMKENNVSKWKSAVKIFYSFLRQKKVLF